MSSPTRPLLFSLEGVSVAYGDDPVLRDITLSIREGERVALYGASGAGKTTLLRKLHALRPDRSALIHQDYALVPRLSVFHNVYAGRLDRTSAARNLRNLVSPAAEDLDTVSNVLVRVGLADRLRTPVADLSGGQQQRVAVARAVYRGDDVILADEPVASVDPRQSTDILRVIVEAADTVVAALHDVTLGLETFTRAVGLRQGRIVFDLPAESVTRERLDVLYAPC